MESSQAKRRFGVVARVRSIHCGTRQCKLLAQERSGIVGCSLTISWLQRLARSIFCWWRQNRKAARSEGEGSVGSSSGRRPTTRTGRVAEPGERVSKVEPGLIYIEYGNAAPILVMGSSQSKASWIERRMRPNRHVCSSGPGSEVATSVFGRVKLSAQEWNLRVEALERQGMSDPAGLCALPAERRGESRVDESPLARGQRW